ncbi:MAG: M23 family metallopeptidase [Clostridia bacterium]|nr:M23 family metallopeptidase [Clostridia bacterium]
MMKRLKLRFTSILSKLKNKAVNLKNKAVNLKRKAANVVSKTDIRTLVGKYGYYAGLFVLLIMLGLASNAYRSGQRNDSDAESEVPVEVSAIVTAVPTAEPTPAPAPEEKEYLWPVSGGIITPFSDDALIWSESLLQWQTHPAIDISAAAGESVCACTDGTVKDAYNDPLWGNVIVIVHDGGTESLYANLSTLNLVKVGEEVKGGEIISAVGNTAAAEGEMPWHLHFEFRNENGENVDFSDYVSSDGGSRNE